jgi:hypothetical protein
MCAITFVMTLCECVCSCVCLCVCVFMCVCVCVCAFVCVIMIEQGLFHNAAAVCVAVQVLRLASIPFQLRLLRYIQRQVTKITVNQPLLCAVDIVSALVDTFRHTLLGLNDPTDQRSATADYFSSAAGTASVSAPDERRVLVTALMRVFASFSCSGNDVRSLLSLLNEYHPNWQMALEILIDAIHSGSAWPYLQFQLARKGVACLHIANMSSQDHTWPPSSGYSFAIWFYIDRYSEVNNDIPLRLLSLVSADSRSITDMYVRNRHLVLQTSAKQMVSFDEFKFDENRWYHVVLTHTKHIITTSSVRLYVNGTLLQTAKLAYINSSSANISGWIGTPPQYEMKSDTQWRLASCLFIDDVLDENLVSHLYHEGPNIAGLLHSSSNHAVADVIDSYYTRSVASAEAFKSHSAVTSHAHVGASDRDPKVQSVPVDRIVFAYHARNGMQASQLIPGLTVQHQSLLERRESASEDKFQMQSKLDPHDQLLLNSGLPNVSHAVFRGDCRVYYPVPVADALRQIGGLRVLLPLFERDLSPDALRNALILLALLLRENPKNLREFDLMHGFDIIALLLKRQQVVLDVTLHELLAGLSGLAQSGSAGQIAVVPAFSAFCLDYDLLTRSSVSVQQFVFQSLLGAISDNPNAALNIRHVHSCHTFPSLLRTLCDPRVPDAVLPYVVAVIKCLVLDCDDTALQYEHLGLLANTVLVAVTIDWTETESESSSYASSTTAHSSSSPPPKSNSTAFPSPSSNPTDPAVPVNLRWHSTRALLVRNILLHMLLQVAVVAPLPMLAVLTRTLTPTWLLGIVDAAPDDKHPVAASLALRLGLVLSKRDPLWLQAFRDENGFVTLGLCLKVYAGTSGVYEALLYWLFHPLDDLVVLLPLQVPLHAQDEKSLDLTALQAAFAMLHETIPILAHDDDDTTDSSSNASGTVASATFRVELVLTRLATTIRSGRLSPDALSILRVLVSLVRHSIAVSEQVAPGGGRTRRGSEILNTLPMMITRALSASTTGAATTALAAGPLRTAPIQSKATGFFASLFSSSTDDKPPSDPQPAPPPPPPHQPPPPPPPGPPSVATKPPPPPPPADKSRTTATGTSPPPAVPTFRERANKLLPAGGALQIITPAVVERGSVTELASSTLSQAQPDRGNSFSGSSTYVTATDFSASFTHHTSPGMTAQSKCMHLPMPSSALDETMLSIVFELFRKSDPLKQVCARLTLLQELTVVVFDSLQVPDKSSHRRQMSAMTTELPRPSPITLLPESTPLDDEVPSVTDDLQLERKKRSAPTSTGSRQRSQTMGSFETARADEGACDEVQASLLMPSLNELAVETDCFDRPTVLRILEWLPHVLWFQLVHDANGFRLLSDLLASIPTSSTPFRVAYTMRVLLGLAQLVRSQVDDDCLDQHRQLSDNLTGLVNMWVDQLNTGWLARGCLVIVDTLFILIERLQSYRSHRTFVQTVYKAINKICILTFCRKDLVAEHRVRFINALMDRHVLFFGPYQLDQAFLSDLTYQLCCHMLVLSPFALSASATLASSSKTATSSATFASSSRMPAQHKSLELQTVSMQLMARLMSCKLDVMEDLLVSRDGWGHEIDLYNRGFDKLIGNEIQEFHVWLYRPAGGGSSSSAASPDAPAGNADRLRLLMQTKWEKDAQARYQNYQDEKIKALEHHISHMSPLIERLETQDHEAEQLHADINLRLWGRRHKVCKLVSSMLLRGWQAQFDHDQFIRRKWVAIRAELRYAGLVLRAVLCAVRWVGVRICQPIVTSEKSHAESHMISQSPARLLMVSVSHSLSHSFATLSPLCLCQVLADNSSSLPQTRVQSPANLTGMARC